MTLIKILNFIISHSLSLKWRLFYLICLLYGIVMRERNIVEGSILLKKCYVNAEYITNWIMNDNNFTNNKAYEFVKS